MSTKLRASSFVYYKLVGAVAALLALFVFLPRLAEAAITVNAPPIDAFFADATVGGGAIVPLAQFRLIQSSGSDTLTKVGFTLIASTTMTQGEVSRVSLWKESGAHPGFQSTEDTFLSGAASTSPLFGALVVLTPTTPVTISTTPVEFFVVASTTASGSLVSTHAFNLRMDANYASTSASTGIGASFISNKKVIMSTTANVKVSEIKLGATGNTEDEFIELYNSSDVDINLQDLPLNLHIFNTAGGAQAKTLTYYKKIIPKFGYFLLGSATNYSGSVPLDASYDTITAGQFTLGVDQGFSIATSSTLANATSTAMDIVCWGSEAAANCENINTVGTPGAPLNLQNGTSMERLAQGFPNATSTAAGMRPGGSDYTKGNGFDGTDNSTDFVVETNPEPQNSSSPTEFPFGGGGQDSSTLQVQGSFPGDNMTNAPTDMTFIGFNFNKSVATTTIISAAATTTVTLTTGGGSNLCTSVTYNPFPNNFEPAGKCNLSATLSPSSTYTFTVSNVYDLAGNRLDQDQFQSSNQNYAITFTTGAAGQTFTNVTPPRVVGSSPFPGALNIPKNLTKISLGFSTDMKVSTLNNTNITLVGPLGNIALTGFAFSAFGTTTGQNVLVFTPGALAANSVYTLTVGVAVQSSNSVGLPSPYVVKFTTGTLDDLSAPTVVGFVPTPQSTILANTNLFSFTFDDNIDFSTATSGAATLRVSGGANLPGKLVYDPVAKEGRYVPNNVLPIGQNVVLTLIGAAWKNSSGILLGTDIVKQWTVEATNSDAAAPSLLFASANDFELSATFNEAVNSTDATTLGNYTLTVGGVAQSLSALAGHSVSYDSSTRTAKISGVRMASGSAFTLAVSNIRDISNNTMTSASSVTGTVASFSTGGGFTGPGAFTGTSFGEIKDFTSSGIGFMPPVNAKPFSPFVSASTTYMFELPISKQIVSGGSVVVTFPSSSDFDVCCVSSSATTDPYLTQQNTDINGPGTGTVSISSMTGNLPAKTVTVVLGANTQTNDFLRFGVANVKNPSVPKSFDSSGYVLDIKSKDSSGTVLESFSANPIFINGGSVGGGATTTIRGRISGNGGKLELVNVHLMSPQTGPLDATTDSDGVYQFTNVPVNTQFLTNNFGGGGEYMLMTDPFLTGLKVGGSATTTTFFGQSMPSPVQATSTSEITRNFSLTPTTGATSFAVKVTASASTFSATENIDFFAAGPGQFVVQTATPGADALLASTQATLSIPKVNGFWNVGMGPAMPKTGSAMSGPPPMPNWAVPKPISVEMSGCPDACVAKVNGTTASSYTFTISTADKTIAGIVKDGSSNAMASVMVYAFSPTGGIGNFTQTAADGTFSIKVVTGSYVVGASSPGIGNSRELTAVVNSSGSVFVDGSPTASTGSSGANPFTLKMVKPSYKITGRVTDGTNAVGNAPVFAYRTDAPGHVDATSDSSTGNYTLYLANGTWKVSAFIPGFGPMAEQTITMASADQSDINFAPSSGTTFSILSGNIYEDASSNNTFNAGEGITSAIIRLSGASGSNEGVSGNDGAFSIRVPAGSGYTITDIFSPTLGRIAALGDTSQIIGAINLTSSTTQNIKIATRKTVTINVKDSSGSALIVPKMFIDLFEATSTAAKFSTHVELTNGTTTTLQVPNNSSSTIRAFIQGVSPANISVASDDTTNTLVLSGVLLVNGNETVKVVVNTTAAGLNTVSGTVYHTSATAGNELADAWIQFVDETNGVHFGTQADSSGAYSTKAANGTYQVLVSKPGYVAAPTTITVSSATTQNFILSSASITITGQVTVNSSATSDSFVRAEKVGGGQSVTKTDTSGNYTLYVTEGTWRVFAASNGYSEKAYTSNPISVSSSVSGVNINITTAYPFPLQSKLATSNTFTDTAAGSFTDSTVGVNIDLDSNALGSAGSNAYVTAQETTNLPNTVSVNIVGNKGKDINAFSGGSKVTKLSSGKTAAVTLTYPKSDLATSSITTTTAVANLKVVAYSDDKKEWESLSTVSTYKDIDGNVVTPTASLSNVGSVDFTAVGTHFSAYALSTPTGSEPPSTPTGLVGNAGTSTITMSWNSVSGAEGYYLYRDTSSSGTFPLLVDAGNVTTYTDTVTSGVTRYYKISAYKSSGASESSASSVVSVSTSGAQNQAGGTGGGTGGGGGGGGGASTTAETTPAVTPAATTTPVATPAVPTPGVPGATPAVPAVPALPAQATALKVSPVFNTTLSVGSKGSDVERLQTVLASDKSVYPEGLVTGYFGVLTRKAIERFQAKYGIVSSGTPATTGFGRLGPKTRAKIKEVFGVTVAPEAPAAPKVEMPAPAAVSAADQERMKAIQAQIDALVKQVNELLAKLKASSGN